jgi:dienelactone hydrolase
MLVRPLAFLLLMITSSTVWSQENQDHQVFRANDSLAPEDDPSEDAKQCLESLVWKCTDFEVTLQPGKQPFDPAIVRFPSPHSTGSDVNDLVALEWYLARNDAYEVVQAPAIIVVHESGSRMDVGRLIAKALNAQGLHAFMIHLPTYGLRRPENFVPRFELVGEVMKQGIKDARRARDAVSVLPLVDSRSISIQGTSLGGFVTATSAGLDRGFTTVHIMVAGGNLFELISNGQREAGKFREMFAKGGFTDEKLKALLAPIEPLRLAHRYDKKNTWLYTASRDQVVPPKHAEQLRKAAGLDLDHEKMLLADHYTGIIYVPIIVTEIAKKIRDELSERVKPAEVEP